MYNRSLIQEALTEKEIGACLQRAFQALPAEDQENIKRVQKELGEIRGMGPVSALRVIFAVDQALTLTRLNEILKGG